MIIPTINVILFVMLHAHLVHNQILARIVLLALVDITFLEHLVCHALPLVKHAKDQLHHAEVA